VSQDFPATQPGTVQDVELSQSEKRWGQMGGQRGDWGSPPAAAVGGCEENNTRAGAVLGATLSTALLFASQQHSRAKQTSQGKSRCSAGTMLSWDWSQC